jgi:hypothetical protein
MRTASTLDNWLPLLLGIVIGGVAPALTYVASHQLHPVSRGAPPGEWSSWVSVWTPVVLAGLAFSATTVFMWFEQAFSGASQRIVRLKAGGMVVLIEIMMTCGGAAPMACMASLVMLVSVNAVATATTLQMQAKKPSKRSK